MVYDAAKLSQWLERILRAGMKGPVRTMRNGVIDKIMYLSKGELGCSTKTDSNYVTEDSVLKYFRNKVAYIICDFRNNCFVCFGLPPPSGNRNQLYKSHIRRLMSHEARDAAIWFQRWMEGSIQNSDMPGSIKFKSSDALISSTRIFSASNLSTVGRSGATMLKCQWTLSSFPFFQ